MIVTKDLVTVSLEVMQVLDDERVVQVNDGWNLDGMGEIVVRSVTLHHRGIGSGADVVKALRGDREAVAPRDLTAIGTEERHRVSFGQ